MFSFGVMGGDHQAQGHTQVLVNLIDFRDERAGSRRGSARSITATTGLLVERNVPEAARDGLDAARSQGDRQPARRAGAFWRISRASCSIRAAVSDGRIRTCRKDGLAIGW